MSIDSETRQRLLELVYDLLPGADAGELRERIDGDEELAEAYAEAEQTAGLFSEAVKLRQPPITLTRPRPVGKRAVPADTPEAAARIEPAQTSPWAKAANWVVGLAAGVLLALSLGGYWYDRRERTKIAARPVRLQVTGPANLHAGVPAEYVINTTTIDGDPLPARIKYAVCSPEEATEPKWHNNTTDEHGRFRIHVPGDSVFASHAVLKVVAEHTDEADEAEAIETRLPVDASRYVTHLALDKPLYRADEPGETVYYRSLTLSRFGSIAQEPTPIRFEILDPGGAVVPDSAVEGTTNRGVGCGAFAVPPGLPGGEYTLLARSRDGSFPERRREFAIRHYRLPRLKKELEFDRDSYAPGATVIADFVAHRAAGPPAADAQLQITAVVDGETIHSEQKQADATGSCQIEFALPEKIDRGDGFLHVTADDGGNREPTIKTIPINLGKVTVEFFPEGGQLAGGLENRVYFVARDPLGEPVDIRGTVIDGNGAVAQGTASKAVATVHDGMGSFTFEPNVTHHYRLQITSPPGVDDQPLPEVSPLQVALNAGPGVFEAGEPLAFELRAAKPRIPLVVSAWCRGVQVGQQTVVTSADPATFPVSIPLDEENVGDVGGVIRLTVHDFNFDPPRPIAERLVYRRPSRGLVVEAGGQSEHHAPGDRVKLSVRVTDETGEAVPAALGVAVVDDRLLSLADDDTAGLQTHVLLSTEIEDPEDLEEADFYLSDDPEAPAALDLLLATRGWRRFVEKTLDELSEAEHDVDALAQLAALGSPACPPAMFDNMAEVRKKYETSVAEYEAGHTKTLTAVTTLSFLGGLALMLLVAMLGLLRVVTGIHLWVPALGVTGCCAAIGYFLMTPIGLIPESELAVAFAEFSIEPPEDEEDGKAKRDDTFDGETKAEAFKREEEEGVKDTDEAADPTAPAEPAPAAPEPADPAPADAPMPALPASGPAAAGEAHDGQFKEALRDKRGRALYLDDMEAGWEMARRRKAAELRRAAAGPGRPRPDAAKKLQAKLGGALGKDVFTVREYRHVRSGETFGVRYDFKETLFWHPLLIADADGFAEVSFDLSDSTTMFRLLADAHHGGRIGSGQSEVVSKLPFSLEPRLPLEVTAGDRIDVPLAVVNDTRSELAVAVSIDHGEAVTLQDDAKRDLALAPEERHREYFALDVTGRKGDCPLAFSGEADGAFGTLGDQIVRKLKVVPPGFPKSLSYSGRIDGTREVVVDLSEPWVPGTLEVTVDAFPSALADLQQGVEGILREPCGCFEQASTSNYPNVLSLQYIQEQEMDAPAAARRARALLKKGYGRLTGYECQADGRPGGYEWFGANPPHEALTAYGLMQFRDMAEVYEVDAKMVDRTAEWLMARSNDEGGFERSEKAVDSFGRATPEITDAYITWALSESGQEGIKKQIARVGELGQASDDPYLVALAAAATINASKQLEDEGESNEEAEKLAEKLAERSKEFCKKLADAQADDGHLQGTDGSITRSGGQALKVETTALAALAWLKQPEFTEQANRAIEWLVANRQGSGGFGSTQATILALKALVEHSKANRKTLAAGKLVIKRDDLSIVEFAFEADRRETIEVDGLEADLQPGENKLSISLTGENQMPYALDVRYRSEKPDDDENCPLSLSTKLQQPQVTSGETVGLLAELGNTDDAEGQPMTVAILGLPAGLEVRTEQLDELKQAGAFDYYETRAREVICYWRSLAPGRKIEIKLDLIAAVPGKYTGPASRTYLYYTSEQKRWADPLSIEITRP